jgi:hypothetical protein
MQKQYLNADKIEPNDTVAGNQRMLRIKFLNSTSRKEKRETNEAKRSKDPNRLV